LFFYVDESGHTGTNLFDSSQQILYYGVLSSRVNVDVLAESSLAKIRRDIGVPRLHAAELGNAGLTRISKVLTALRKKMDLRFDLYQVVKPDHAIISFFDQVFDQGVNPAVTWTGYWTPLRYVLLLKVSYLFDEEIAKRAWSTRIELNSAKAEQALIEICQELRSRVGVLPDARSRLLISDALTWAERNPGKICYNVKSSKDILQITPNIIGFQSVMHGIALRVSKHGKQPAGIVVDQQTQFNKAQRTLSEFFASARKKPFPNGPGLPEIDFSSMPTTPISFRSGTDSAGLELVDIFLWVFKRFMEDKDVAPELFPLVRSQLHRGYTDEISINGIASRWIRWFEELPYPTEDQMEKGREIMAMDEERRLRAIREDT
jgi:hypothetical protein